MSELSDGGPAFPFLELDGGGLPHQQHEGLSIRDYFATHATNDDVSAYIVGPVCEQVIVRDGGRKEVVMAPLHRTREEAKYAYADAMLKARNK